MKDLLSSIVSEEQVGNVYAFSAKAREVGKELIKDFAECLKAGMKNRQFNDLPGRASIVEVNTGQYRAEVDPELAYEHDGLAESPYDGL